MAAIALSLQQRTSDGYELIESLKSASSKDLNGVDKLIRRIYAEINALDKKKRKDLIEERVRCSNLGQLGAVVDVALSSPGVISVLHSFKTPSGNKITCDVVGNYGASWYKVILRNPKALHQIFLYGSKNSSKSILHMAEEFVSAAKGNPYLFNTPAVIFVFVIGISKSLAAKLSSLGVSVQGKIICDTDLNIPDYASHDSDSSEYETESELNDSLKNDENGPMSYDNSESIHLSPSLLNLPLINLDVTCLIAYVSDTSNGACDYFFADKFLNEQSECERMKPVKCILEDYFKGNALIVCQEAKKHFNTIIDTIGGPNEQLRARELLDRCSIVPSQDLFKDCLQLGGKINEKSRKIFGTGHAHRAPTVTSNKGFVRAAQNQGLQVAVLYHDPRALAELKQKYTKPKLNSS